MPESQYKCEEGRLIWTMKPVCTFRTEYCGRSASRRSPKDGGWMCQHHFEAYSKSRNWHTVMRTLGEFLVERREVGRFGMMLLIWIDT